MGGGGGGGGRYKLSAKNQLRPSLFFNVTTYTLAHMRLRPLTGQLSKAQTTDERRATSCTLHAKGNVTGLATQQGRLWNAYRERAEENHYEKQTFIMQCLRSHLVVSNDNASLEQAGNKTHQFRFLVIMWKPILCGWDVVNGHIMPAFLGLKRSDETYLVLLLFKLSYKAQDDQALY